jgi:protein gp37
VKSHTHKSDTAHTGVIDIRRKRVVRDGKVKVLKQAVFNGKLTTLPDGHHLWKFPLDYEGAEKPKLGPGKPSLIWACDLSDLFIEGADRPDTVISRVIATLAQSHHIGQLLTKRTARMSAYFAALDPRTVHRWQPKIWLGFSAENQDWFNQRWPDVRPLSDAGWFVFVSLAPLLAPVTLPDDFLALGKRTWVIVAGEQRVPGTVPRPMKTAWARVIKEQCEQANIPFFMKQMAKGAPRPRDLRIREFPSWP